MANIPDKEALQRAMDWMVEISEAVTPAFREVKDKLPDGAHLIVVVGGLPPGSEIPTFTTITALPDMAAYKILVQVAKGGMEAEREKQARSAIVDAIPDEALEVLKNTVQKMSTDEFRKVLSGGGHSPEMIEKLKDSMHEMGVDCCPEHAAENAARNKAKVN